MHRTNTFCLAAKFTGVVLLGSVVGCLSADEATFRSYATKVVERFVLQPTSLATLAPGGHASFDLDAARREGLRQTDLPSVGSGLDRNAAGDWFGLTDRGPNAAIARPGVPIQRRVFPLPDFAPGIARLALGDGRIAVREFIPLRDPDGVPLTGLGNQPDDEPAYAAVDAAKPLAFDPDGVDPEALRCRPGGGFLIGEEYAPSVLLVDREGRVQSRLVPRGLSLAGARCPVKAILPEVFRQRRTNRGFECLALSPDGRTAIALLQSPVGDPANPRFAGSRIIRAVELDLTDPSQPAVRGHYLVPAGTLNEHPGTKQQDHVKFNDAVWLSSGRLLVIEQARASAVLRLVELERATNLLGRPDENDLALDAADIRLSIRGIQPAASSVLCRLDEVSVAAGNKLEGLCLIGTDRVAVANDNDFGIGDNQTGLPTMIFLLALPELSPGRPFALR